MARMFCLTVVSVVALSAVAPAIAADPIGTWLVEDGTAKVRIVPCGDAICGSVVWLSQPLDAVTGKPQTDKLNADPEKRRRPMLGVAVVLGMQRNSEDNKWIGRIYNPDDGNTYKASLEIVDQARLKIQGCFAVYCQTEYWTRSN